MASNRGWAHILATIIIVLIFLTSVISAFLSVGIAVFGVGVIAATEGEHEESNVPEVAGGVLIVYAGISVAIATLMGWLSFKMVKCEFKCE